MQPLLFFLCLGSMLVLTVSCATSPRQTASHVSEMPGGDTTPVPETDMALPTLEAAQETAGTLCAMLARPDLSTEERAALSHRLALAQDESRFHRMTLQFSDELSHAAASDDLYVLETTLKRCLSTLSSTPSFVLPLRQLQVQTLTADFKQNLTRISRTIRNGEREYHEQKAKEQHGFIQQAAANDIGIATNLYYAGKGRFNDNETRIARAIPHLDRVLRTREVHTSIREVADNWIVFVESELWPYQLTAVRSRPPLPGYTDELNYPRPCEREKRAFANDRLSRRQETEDRLTESRKQDIRLLSATTNEF
jgi:hypothetical protein